MAASEVSETSLIIRSVCLSSRRLCRSSEA